MMKRTHNAEADVRSLAMPQPGCVGLLGRFLYYQ